MNPSTAPAAVKPVDYSLSARLENAQRELAARRAQTERATTITLVVSLILVLLLAFYFIYGYVMIKQTVEPSRLVPAAETLLNDYLKTARPELEKKIAASAPEWTKSLSVQFLKSMPDVRARLEVAILDQVTDKMDEAQLLTSQHFQSFVKDNRAMIEANLKELASNEKLTKEHLKELQQALEKSFQSDMQSQSRSMLEGLESLAKRMKRLAANKNLTQEESVERKLFMLARRMQLEKDDPTLLEPADNTSTLSEAPKHPTIVAPKDAPVRRTPRKKGGKPDE